MLYLIFAMFTHSFLGDNDNCNDDDNNGGGSSSGGSSSGGCWATAMMARDKDGQRNGDNDTVGGEGEWQATIS